MIIDTHCHLYKKNYDNLDEIISKMDGIMITAGCDDESNLEVIENINKYNNVYGVLGIHPEELNKITGHSFQIIEDNINNPKILGVGEVGLDYYWDVSNRDYQKETFIKQLELAKKYNKAVVVHSRDAIEDTYDIMKNYQDVKFILHCYGSSLEMAERFIDSCNVMFGIGGVVTFKNGTKLKEVVAGLDLKYLLLETDSPYLAPEPFRGKINEPANTNLIAQKIAEIKGITKEEVIKATTVNAVNQFDLDITL
jgi:TatD DNase family protein